MSLGAWQDLFTFTGKHDTLLSTDNRGGDYFAASSASGLSSTWRQRRALRTIHPLFRHSSVRKRPGPECRGWSVVHDVRIPHTSAGDRALTSSGMVHEIDTTCHQASPA